MQGINDTDGPLRGAINRLLEHNEKTRSRYPGSRRFVESPVEVGQIAFLKNGTINTRAIHRQAPGPAKLHTALCYEDGTVWRTIIPLQFIMKGWGDANSGHQCYVHTISRNLGTLRRFEDWRDRVEADSDEYYYVGITGRNWLQRLGEHLAEMRRGSRKRFHKEWRQSLGIDDVQFVSSLMDINLNYEDAMKWEEVAVDRFAYGPCGLNMIPGGFKGLRYLHKLGIIARRDISLDERDEALGEYLRRNPRKGIPNPFMAELWRDDDHYLRVNAAHPKRLSRAQVLRIRELAEQGKPIEEIADQIGAWSLTQVKNVIAGRTYRRVH